MLLWSISADNPQALGIFIKKWQLFAAFFIGSPQKPTKNLKYLINSML